MARLSLNDRARFAGYMAGETRRAVVAKALSSPFFRWRYGACINGEVLIVPQDLRNADASFWSEVELGHYGLAGTIVDAGEGSPFDIAPPDASWHRELHGFGWLRHLFASDAPAAHAKARDLVMAWLSRRHGRSSQAYQADVIARRIISWLSHADLLLEDTTPAQFDAILSGLDRQLIRLSAIWRAAPPGSPRLTSLLAVVLGNLSLAGHERQLPEATRNLTDELRAQVLEPNGLISRNAGEMADLALDLLPVAQCFKSRDLDVPDALSEACLELIWTLRHVRMGDGSLARFNGTGVGSPAGLATALAYDDLVDGPRPKPSLVRNGYVRLEVGRSIVVMDAAPPPPLECSTKAHAGCLSFEWSHQNRLVFVNNGAPNTLSNELRAAARSTASHTTLRLGDQSSAELVRHAGFERMFGDVPLRLPTSVEILGPAEPTATSIEVCHNGYLNRHALWHTRRITLSDDGNTMTGRDSLTGRTQTVRLPRDVPFAIHFHLAPGARAQRSGAATAVDIRLVDGETFRFEVDGLSIGIEPSQFYADTAGPMPTQQIVLRATTFGETHVNWSVTALAPG